MRLLPHRLTTQHSPSRRLQWHAVRGAVFLLVIISVLLLLSWRAPQPSQQQQQQQQTLHSGTRSNHIKQSDRRSVPFAVHSHSDPIASSFHNSSNTTSNTTTDAGSSNIRGSRISDDDDDGNSELCRKVSLHQGDQCAFARTHCPNPYADGFLNYIQMRYCWFQFSPALFYVFASLWVLLLFYMLGDTAETNFSPALLQMSRMLRLSPDVAGVTFLALGNGAPDIASIIAGVLSGSTGFGIAEPIGSGLFVTSVVMAVVTLLTPEVRVGWSFLRDIGTYFFSVVFVFIIVLNRRIVLWESVACLAIYAVYVSAVVLGRRVIRIIRKKTRSGRGSHGKGSHDDHDATVERQSLLHSSVNAVSYGAEQGFEATEQPVEIESGLYSEDDEETGAEWFKHRQPRMDLKVQHMDDITPEWREHLQRLSGHGRVYAIPKIGILYEEPAAEESLPSGDNVTGSIVIESHFRLNDDTLGDDDGDEEEDGRRNPVIRALIAVGDYIGFNERNWFGKITFLFESPTILVRNLTVPKADPADWSRPLSVLNLVFMPMFIVAALQYYDVMLFSGYIPLVLFAGALGLPLSILVLVTTRSDRAPLYHFAFVALAFVMSILWIYVLANELVSLLQSIGIIWRVSDVILAITVLAWGNSLGDLFADTVVARQGFPEMAVAAIYAGPCLNLLIGLGIAVTYHCIAKEPAFAIEVTPGFTITFIFLMAALAAAATVIVACRFRSPKPLGAMLLVLYLVFMTVSMLTEFGVLWPEVS